MVRGETASTVALRLRRSLPQHSRETAEAVDTRRRRRRRRAVAVPDLRGGVPAGKYLKGLSGEVRLALGPVPVVGEDDTLSRRTAAAEPVEPVKFTIRAEKCPNRRGVRGGPAALPGRGARLRRVVRSAQAGRAQGSCTSRQLSAAAVGAGSRNEQPHFGECRW